MKKQFVWVVVFLVAIFSTVGYSVKAGEGHDHGGSHAVEKKSIQAEGVLNSVDQKKHKVNITHGPIAALGWPPMRMDFSIKHGMDVSSLKKGQKIQFVLEKEDEYDYVITKISSAH